MKELLRALLIVLVTLHAAGCPSLWNLGAVPEKTASAEDLFKEAEENFEKKKYSDAVDLYERLKSAYPDFKKIPEVHLQIAEAFFNEGSYEKAIGRYLQFIELFPHHKEVARAKYQIAMSYFNQIRRADLDNRVVKQAADSFKVLSEDADAGEWQKKAEEKYKECLKKLAEKEIYKAKTYMSMSRYPAARQAAQRVLDDFAKMGYDEEAKDLLKKIKGK